LQYTIRRSTMEVTVSASLFDDEPIFYLPQDDSDEVCQISLALRENQIIVFTIEGTFLITIIRNGPSTVRRME
ncbi:hypothetical protein KAR91_03095, partial [Candidatus Pacearchaeota archaeon]|nr:hypothetical protein [Candidatus Pacearchaeota archaeon]